LFNDDPARKEETANDVMSCSPVLLVLLPSVCQTSTVNNVIIALIRLTAQRGKTMKKKVSQKRTARKSFISIE